MADLGSGIQIIAGHTFPVLTNLLEAKGHALVGESPFIAAIVMKAIKEKEIEDDLLLELYEFLCTYCSRMGPMISFSDEETDLLLTHLCCHIPQIEKSDTILHHSNIQKKGKNKRTRADLNVETSSKQHVNEIVHAAALNAITALLVSDPRAVTEEKFKSVANLVAREALSVNASRYALTGDCVYAEAENRTLLYKLLELVAKYPVHPKHRPLHIALHVFAEAAVWDTRDTDLHIPTLCRNALLTLELITDPVIAPLVCHSESAEAKNSSEESNQNPEPHADVDQHMHDEVEEQEEAEPVVQTPAVNGERGGQSPADPVMDNSRRIDATSTSGGEAAAPVKEQDDVCVLEQAPTLRSSDNGIETYVTAPSSAGKMTDTITISDDSGDETPSVSLPNDEANLVHESLPLSRESGQEGRKTQLGMVRTDPKYMVSVFDEPDPESEDGDRVEESTIKGEVTTPTGDEGIGIDEILAAGDFEY